MAATDQFALAVDSEFRQRTLILMVKVALQVQAEDPQTANHAERSALAYRCLYDPDGMARLFALAVAANPAVLPGAPDGDIEFSVSAVWDAFALGGG